MRFESQLSQQQQQIIGIIKSLEGKGERSVNKHKVASLLHPDVSADLNSLELLGYISVRGDRIKLKPVSA